MDKAISYIKENANTEKPFFVYLPLAAPHNPILPIGKWKGKSEINPYADFVIMIDDLMGRIFETIEAQGIEENTLVIFTSDNGCSNQADIPMLQKNGHYPSYIYKGLKGSYFEGGHRVPFLVKWPKVIKPNSISDATICTTDFIATCADIIGYTFNEAEAEDSFSMLPLLTEQGAYKREATVHHSKSGIFAIWKGDWKLIVSPNSGLNAADKKEKIRKVLPDNMLYNLNADPKEQNNLALEHPEKVKELRQLLIKYVLDGRSTPGRIQKNDSIFFLWPQIEFSADVTQDE
ncbi:MAG: sulfatase-like hydrolase/transferase [Bacteroidota bacterium]